MTINGLTVINEMIKYFISQYQIQQYLFVRQSSVHYLQVIINLMFSKQVERINNLLSDRKQNDTIPVHSIGLISNNICRKSAHSRMVKSSRPKYQSEISLIKQGIPSNYTPILYQLFKAKCFDLSLQPNQKNWQAFIKSFISKNKISSEKFDDEVININDFCLGENSVRQINILLQMNPAGVRIRLNKNIINPNNLVRLQTMKELSLCNCKLGNDALEQLFLKLQQSVIEKICLSSPQVKNRNQLTRYKVLIGLIQKSATLHTLELSNIEIQPDSMILESCRNTSLKHIDLSDNTNVKGICVSLNSLNLSRNSIIYPFTFPMAANQISYLNLSYNKIPNFHFKEFLKHIYFVNLKHLVLDNNKLDGDMSSMTMFLQHSISMHRLSIVNCQLSQQSYSNILNGLKHNKTIQMIDLSHNKVPNERIAECIANSFQMGNLKEIKMRYCQIKDNLGEIIFKNIQRNKTIEKIDMTNNLLGDKTAKTIRFELQSAKNITFLLLQENIIKYKDMQQINSYLEGNKYFNVYQLDKEYNKLLHINNQIKQASLIINSEETRISNLQKQTEQLQEQFMNKFKVENKIKKAKIKEQIYTLRDEQNMLMTDITFMQALPSMTEMNSIQSRRQSFLQLQSFTNL